VRRRPSAVVDQEVFASAAIKQNVNSDINLLRNSKR